MYELKFKSEFHPSYGNFIFSKENVNVILFFQKSISFKILYIDYRKIQNKFLARMHITIHCLLHVCILVLWLFFVLIL